jgi:hypothetical protein
MVSLKKKLFKLSSYYSAFLLSVLWAQQLLWDAPLDASCLNHKAFVLGDMTQEDPAVTFKKSTVRLNSAFACSIWLNTKDITSLYSPPQFGFYNADSLLYAWLELFLNAFAKLWKATISFLMSVRLSPWHSSASIKRIFMKSYI